ncbi:MAG: cytoskeletal protein CcmA (bactofilin family) [Saprospiraceae bacterium]|jgi:cytoskeletal protein CcmA (bactofilin family)
MFTGKNKNENSKTTIAMQSVDQSSCVISKGTTIEGKFKTTEDLRLDGTIRGEIQSDKKIVMGETGRIEGIVTCNESAIKGRIEGEINVNGLLHLLSTAFIKGKIRAKKMIVDEGATYNGECLIGEQHFKKQSN